MNGPQKYLNIVSALAISVFSVYGFYLIRGNPKIESLATSGHVHLLLFAYGAILFGYLLAKTNSGKLMQKLLAFWMSLTFLGPIFITYAGVTGNRSALAVTTPLFMGSFAALWFIMAFLLASSRKK